MTTSPDTRTVKESKAGAGAAGAGGGTLLVMLANTLSNLWKSWLIVASPSVSIILSALWLWFQVGIANYVQDLKLKQLVRSTKAILLEALDNPNTSDDHREAIRKRLEELELIIADRQMKQIRSLSPVTASDIRKT